MSDTDIIETIRILQDGDPLLNERSAEVTEFGDDLKNLIARMVSVVRATDALGLAAAQIGEPVRVIVFGLGENQRWMINPVLVGKPFWRSEKLREGCLSVPDECWVERPVKCEVAWQDEEGRPHQMRFEKLLARVLQHEIDHLDGVLISGRKL